MDYFHYKRGHLYCEDVRVSDIVKKYSTPLYIYSLKTLVRHFKVTSQAFGDIPHIICYAAKANSNLAILKVAALCGAGADVVSGNELLLAGKAGIKNDRIVFSGVGKTDEEIELAVRSKILFICAESFDEIEAIAKIARRNRIVAPVAVRVNPAIDPRTHPHIATGLKQTKFGLSENSAKKAYRICRQERWLDPVGISMHIGSQVETVKPYVDSTRKIVNLYKYLLKQNISLKYIDIGGGWAAQFERDSVLPHPDDYVSAISDLFTNLPVTVVAEPGRSLVGNAGILIMKVISTKKGASRNFCIVDAGINDFIRPALYGANHRIEPICYRSGRQVAYDVVGPVCENSDFLAKSIRLPRMVKGDILALFTAGAYGRVMSSNYNGRLRAVEVAVAGSNVFPIRTRENLRDLVRGQRAVDISRKIIEELL